MKKSFLSHSIYILFAALGLLACSKKDNTPSVNHAPGTFTVKSELQADGKTIKLSWTAAVDPDGDIVTYNVVAGTDTVAKAITDLSYTLSNLNYNATVQGKIIAKDSKGMATEVSFSSETAKVVGIPDAVFEQALIDLKYDSDAKVNGFMSFTDAWNIIHLDVSKKGINDLTGISEFINLQFLDATNNNLTNIDLSNNKMLITLRVGANKLSKIDVSKNVLLASFLCNDNKISNIDISNNIELREVYFSGNPVSALDLSKNFKLTSFVFGFGNLTTIDFTKNTALTYIDCSSNALSSRLFQT